ncbi:hypothetical protein [Halarcobacter bivalviorum]|uniref:Lipoprotein n=1 Tax=Halarcobacter bivalviorum TaxID=663364 RepID=A0AAX2AAK2_9BACT|nr:hypothetical protein [Halarcobacter bivalviorum]AXH12596.1 hypothetical protein ABIV_1606 [Halarcobacter bivalviorum]RXK10480.1 hypothetical protein CRV05_04170 [Halarcobacter bivalviorum]
MIYIVLAFITIFFSSCSSLNINFPKEEVVSKKVLERKTVVTLLSDEQNNKTNITYSEDSDLLIYGDRTNPNKITYTDKENFQSWGKDDIFNFIF